jgi:hypothetical protein
MVTRRGFLLLFAASPLARAHAQPLPRPKARSASLAPLSPSQVEQVVTGLGAAAELLVPGAQRLGVDGYFRARVAGPDDALAALRVLHFLDEPAGSFAALRPAEQHARVAALAREHAGEFQTLRRWTFEACYGDPRHGGNRDRAAWAGLEFP